MTTDGDSGINNPMAAGHSRRGVLAALAACGALLASVVPGGGLSAKKKKKKKKKSWTHVTNFGTQGELDANFSSPFGVALSADGRTAWVADSSNNRISVWTRPSDTSTTWSYSSQFGSAGNEDFNIRPLAIAVSADACTAFVADSSHHRISVWTRPDGNSTNWSHSFNFGSGPSSGEGGFNAPRGVTISVDGRTALVADTQNHRISVWTKDDVSPTTWNYAMQFGGQGSADANFNQPQGVALSADALTAWVVDTQNMRISVWIRPDAASTAWTHNGNFGVAGKGESDFLWPRGVAVAPDGLNVWVADNDANRISIWTRTSTTSTTWTHSANFGTQTGDETDLTFPSGVAVSANGLSALVADTDNNRISIWKYA